MQPVSSVIGSLAILLGAPTLAVASQPTLIAQVQQPSFPGWAITTSIASYQTSGGFYSATIKIHIRNDAGRDRALSWSERQAIQQMVLVDAQNQAYRGTVEGDLESTFAYGENRTLEFNTRIPMGIYLQYLYLQVDNDRAPLKLPV